MQAAGWSAVVPLKPPASAKQRLAGLGDWRPALAAAFAADVVSALLGSDHVREVVVVGGGGLSADLLAAARVHRVADVRGLNAAVEAGIRVARRAGAASVLVLPADLPCLRTADVDALVRASPPDRAAVLADAEGGGTTALLVPAAVEFAPAFGADSFARHLRAGASTLQGRLATARRDVDTIEHLEAARQLGLGHHTAEVLARLDAAVGAQAPIETPLISGR